MHLVNEHEGFLEHFPQDINEGQAPQVIDEQSARGGARCPVKGRET